MTDRIDTSPFIASHVPAVVPPARRSKAGFQLYHQVLIGIVLGITLGMVDGEIARHMKIFSDLFIRLLKCLLAPLIFCTIVRGITGGSSDRSVGKIMAQAMIYFTAMTALALIVSVAVADIFRPGLGFANAAAKIDAHMMQDYMSKAPSDFTWRGQLLGLIPETYFTPFVKGEILQVLLLAVLTAAALRQCGDSVAPLKNLINAGADMLFALIKMMMYLAPAAAFGAMAYTIGTHGSSAILPLLNLIFLFYITGFLFVLLVFGGICRYCGFSVFALCRYLKEELLLVLGMSSSEPAMPALINKLEKMGVPPGICGIVVPAGYSFNLDGTALSMPLTLLFVGQAMNIHLDYTQQAQLVLLCMLTAKGAAGVVGSGMIVMVATLQTSQLIPVAGLSLVLGIDRFMSECRALVNFIGNAVASLALANYRGQLDRDKLKAALSQHDQKQRDAWDH